MSVPFDKYLNEEVFVVGVDNTEPAGQMEMFTSASELFKYLKYQIEVGIDPDVRVLHGILTKADVLPSSIKNKAAFILAIDPDYNFNITMGCIIEQCYTEINELATEIETTIGTSMGTIVEVDMDYIYILYGYELKPFISVDLGDVDEETIHVCKKIALESESIRTKTISKTS